MIVRLAPAALRAQWHVYGTTWRQVTADAVRAREIEGADLGLCIGAGEGNRTLMTSLEGWGSAIELRPHVWRGDKVPARRARIAYPHDCPVQKHRGRQR